MIFSCGLFTEVLTDVSYLTLFFPFCLAALENHFEEQTNVSRLTGNELEQIYKTDFGTKDVFIVNDKSSAKTEFKKKKTQKLHNFKLL